MLPDLTGFHAKRLEFEPEYDAEAEALLADLEFRCVQKKRCVLEYDAEAETLLADLGFWRANKETQYNTTLEELQIIICCFPEP